MGISIEVNANAVLRGLGTFFDGLRDRATINRKVSIQLYGFVLRNFQQGGALQTPPWQPLKASTLKQKARLGYSPLPLLRTGHLRQSFAPFSDENVAGVGAKASEGVDYAEFQEEGTKTIPARPMLPTEKLALDTTVQIYGLEIARLRQVAGI